MQPPRMILFDYGETLVHERCFDGVRGSQEVLRYATRNPHNLTGAQVQAVADRLNGQIGRYLPATGNSLLTEVHNRQFHRYLYELLDLEFSQSSDMLEEVFWDAACPGEAMPGANHLLEELHRRGMRTGGVSNIAVCGETLRARLDRLLPANRFEFFLPSSDYVFRKPSPLIFELALHKAGLPPGEVWYCGDNPVCDVEGAAGAGIFPVWYAPHPEGKQPPAVPHLHIRSWEELLACLPAAAPAG